VYMRMNAIETSGQSTKDKRIIARSRYHHVSLIAKTELQGT
jgi:hypothetical protein